MSNTDTTAERAAVGQLIRAFKKYAAGHLAASLAENDEYVALRQIFWVILSSGGELLEECRT